MFKKEKKKEEGQAEELISVLINKASYLSSVSLIFLNQSKNRKACLLFLLALSSQKCI